VIRRRKPVHANHERWLVSYADFITLLFAFFVVLYASAQIDKKKVGMLSESIQYAFQDMGVFGQASKENSPGPSHVMTPSIDPDKRELNRIQSELGRALDDEIKRREVFVHMEREGLVISLRELGFFDTGSAELRPESRNAFGRVVGVLETNPRMLRVEGHTDNVPIHNRNFKSNWELSTARATEVVRVLVTEYGYAADKLSASGYGEFHPNADNGTETGRQANRRVDIVVLSAPHDFTGSVR
jgi:chemotaxis protein MotB